MDEELETRDQLIEIIKLLPEEKLPPLIDFLNHLVNDFSPNDDGDQEDQLLMDR